MDEEEEEESDDGEDSEKAEEEDEKDGADEEEYGSEDNEEDEDDEIEEDKKCRYAFGLVMMIYVLHLNVLSDKNFKEMLKYICAFKYVLIYDIMGL